ncbi:MAG: hypothetical protein LBV54_08070 [Puniceicoccales bacterium]|nr:hypothetical protein [Puniceicoccales bacterium]
MKIVNYLLVAGAAALTACAHQGETHEHCKHADKDKGGACCKKPPVFNNADFYAANGKFNEEAAKDAIIRLLKYHNYPVTAKTREKLWVSDYGTGHFTEVGLAAILFDNNEKDLYMLQDLFLLPNQMLPEHWHEKPSGDLPAKMEGWVVRAGSTYTVGEGEDNLASFPEIKIPASHTGGVTVKNATKLLPGDYDNLKKVFGHHWQFAGPEGAIITEVANIHSNPSVRHQVPNINAHFLKK